MIEQKIYLIEKINFGEVTTFNNKITDYITHNLINYCQMNKNDNKNFKYFNFLSGLLTPYHIRTYLNNHRSKFLIENDKVFLKSYITILSYFYSMNKYKQQKYMQISTSVQLLYYINGKLESMSQKEIKKLRRFYMKELLNQKGDNYD